MPTEDTKSSPADSAAAGLKAQTPKMPSIEPVSPALIQAFKTVRLRALADAPTAFGSTYARESQFSGADWLSRAATWNSETSACYLAMEDGHPCGIAAGKLDEASPGRAHLLSMWVSPAHRRTGLGRMLVSAVQTWAKSVGVRELALMVTSVNQGAVQFYRRLGFTMTGVTGPYPNDPAILEYEMLKNVAGQDPTT